MQDKLEELKVIAWYIMIGTASGLIQIGSKEHKNKTKFEKFCVWLTSFSFAIFVTPLFVWMIESYMVTEIPKKVEFGICFFSGQFGEKFLTTSVRIYKNVDWKSVIISIIESRKKK